MMMLGTRTLLFLFSLYAASSTSFTRPLAARQGMLSRLLFSSNSNARAPSKDGRSNVVALHMMMGIFTIKPRIGAAETLPVIESETSVTTLKQETSWKDQQADKSPSVHLKLGSETMMAPPVEESITPATKRDQAILHTYKHCDIDSVSGLNVAKEKFEHWLRHRLPVGTIIDPVDITTQDVSIAAIRQDLRNLWKSRRLLCDRTELLTVYQSDLNMTTTDPPHEKRGGFTDLLHLYAERHVGIVQDEIEDSSNALLQWLQTEYASTTQLLATNFHTQPQETQRLVLQSFLDWFRSNFPYYYDMCYKCGASCKQDGEDEGSFLGYVYPENHEVAGKAGRTEIYQCHKCQAVTRFPRFNAASHVLQQKRGRCGEYSMLMYRMLRATGHETRWIVDWADHVWCELLWQGRWVHLDPCEAAIDAPLLYQEWGKQQTYIMAFYAPLCNLVKQQYHPTIEDVTTKYTSDEIGIIQDRRDASAAIIDSTIAKVSWELKKKLSKMMMK
jgi:Transglutaminase-like superfamily